MAKSKSTTRSARAQATVVDADALRETFGPQKIPLSEDFTDLINMADAGCRAAGQAVNQEGPGQGLKLSGNGALAVNFEDIHAQTLIETCTQLSADRYAHDAATGITLYIITNDEYTYFHFEYTCMMYSISLENANEMIIDSAPIIAIFPCSLISHTSSELVLITYIKGSSHTRLLAILLSSDEDGTPPDAPYRPAEISVSASHILFPSENVDIKFTLLDPFTP